MKKRWILVALAVGLLSAAIAGGVALAGGGHGHGHGWKLGHDDNRLSDLGRKVAGILGTGEQETVEAIAQARKELRDEAHDAALADLAGRVAEIVGSDADETEAAIKRVSEEMSAEALEAKLQDAIDDGRITEEQAQEYRDNADSAGRRGFRRGFGGKATNEEFATRVAEELDLEGDVVADALEQAMKDIRSEAAERRLQAAIDSGKITEEQAEEIRDKIESGDWNGFGKRGRHGRHGGKGLWGRGHRNTPTVNPAPASGGDSA